MSNEVTCPNCGKEMDFNGVSWTCLHCGFEPDDDVEMENVDAPISELVD